MPPHSLTNFEIQKSYQNEAKFMVLIPEIIYLKQKIRAYVINFDEY